MIKQRPTKVLGKEDFDYGGDRSTPVTRSSRDSGKKGRSPEKVSSWRDSNDYRTQYFERNKGIGGYGYICSQCWKPMFRKSQIQVDHILPPSRFAVKRKRKTKDGVQWEKTSFLSRALNHSFNCAAICPDCNRRKSDKIDTKVIQGYVMKSIEISFQATQFIVSIPFMGAALCLWATRKVLTTAFSLVRGNSKKRR